MGMFARVDRQINGRNLKQVNTGHQATSFHHALEERKHLTPQNKSFQQSWKWGTRPFLKPLLAGRSVNQNEDSQRTRRDNNLPSNSQQNSSNEPKRNKGNNSQTCNTQQKKHPQPTHKHQPPTTNTSIQTTNMLTDQAAATA